ncbi:MAG: hypothetical protein P8Y60_19790 [Calditrichota bacterium]
MNISFCIRSTLGSFIILGLVWGMCICSVLRGQSPPQERIIQLAEISENPVTLQAEIGESLPDGAEEYVLPICAGVVVNMDRTDLIHWLQAGSPWSLSELPALGLRYQDQMVVVIVPWPHYAELVVTDRIGIRFSFPHDRDQATPCEIVLMRRQPEPLEVAKAFRGWCRHHYRDLNISTKIRWSGGPRLKRDREKSPSR